MTEQGIGLPSPIGPCRLSLLKGNCQISKPKWRQEGSFLPFPLFFFFSSVLLWRLCSPLCLWRVETVDERESIILDFLFSLCAGSVKLALVLSSVGHLGVPCVASSPTHPTPFPIPNSPTILCLVNGCLWWPINTGRLGMGFSITKVVPQRCNPPPPFLPHTFVRRQEIQYINSLYQHRQA